MIYLNKWFKSYSTPYILPLNVYTSLNETSFVTSYNQKFVTYKKKIEKSSKKEEGRDAKHVYLFTLPNIHCNKNICNDFNSTYGLITLLQSTYIFVDTLFILQIVKKQGPNSILQFQNIY